MSSCFLCDCSYKFKENTGDKYSFAYQQGTVISNVEKLMKQVPIMVGSSGTDTNDQQHDNDKNQNYVSYRIKKIEFCGDIKGEPSQYHPVDFPDYVLIFKVPFRAPVFDYYFGVLQNFMLYSEPECVLGYKVLQPINVQEYYYKGRSNFKIEINKPFILGPNEYLGVFYMIGVPTYSYKSVDASAKVWFDVA